MAPLPVKAHQLHVLPRKVLKHIPNFVPRKHLLLVLHPLLLLLLLPPRPATPRPRLLHICGVIPVHVFFEKTLETHALRALEAGNNLPAVGAGLALQHLQRAEAQGALPGPLQALQLRGTLQSAGLLLLEILRGRPR